MPVVDLCVQVFGDTVQDMRRGVGEVELPLRFRRARHRHGIGAVSCKRHDVFDVCTPFSVDNLDRDQTGQALLLAASVQSRKLCANSDGGGGYGVLDGGSWAGDISSNGLEVVFNSAVVRLVGRLTVVSCMLS